MLHCGLSFWHIRRNNRNAFYEPVSVSLATLKLWAYSTYASRKPTATQNETLENLSGTRSGCITRDTSPGLRSATSQPEPMLIRLDCPNDDDMVHLFVRYGVPSAMRAHITGVRNIYSPQGPANILREGRRILASVSLVWGHSQEYASILEALEGAGMEHTMAV